jgi:hypothetical protein
VIDYVFQSHFILPVHYTDTVELRLCHSLVWANKSYPCAAVQLITIFISGPHNLPKATTIVRKVAGMTPPQVIDNVLEIFLHYK